MVTSSGNIATLTIGDTTVFTISDSNYPASAWSCKLALTKDGSNIAQFTGTPVGDSFSFSVKPVSPIAAGPAQAWLVFTNIATPTLRYSEDIGLVTVLPDPMGTLTASELQLTITALDATIKAIVSQPEFSASFNGQTYTLHNIKDLYEIRGQLQIRLDNELRASGVTTRGSGFRIIKTRFR